ncbi:zinc-ribbon domain-containing protein [[Eubacterium] cellulosolvens]
MPFCVKCGSKLEKEAGFCSKCGTATQRGTVDLVDSITEALKAAAREIEVGFKTAREEIDKAFSELKEDRSRLGGPFCPRCGKRNPHDAKFCFACGGNIPSET